MSTTFSTQKDGIWTFPSREKLVEIELRTDLAIVEVSLNREKYPWKKVLCFL
jgi:hypothetical protein